MNLNTNRLKEIWLSQKHHFHYFGTSTVISLSLLTTCWVIALVFIRQEIASAQLMFGYLCMSLAAVGFGGALIILHGVLAAHRVSSTFLRLENVCRAVGEGDLKARLDLGSNGDLRDLESAFNGMLEMLERRIS